MKHTKKMFQSFALAAGLMLSASSYSATEWKMAVGDGAGSAQEAMGLKFVELLKEKTGGEYSAHLFVNGQLGSEQTTVNDAAMGVLDMSIAASNNIAPFSPALGILSLPYIFENIEQAKTVVEGPIGESLSESLVKDAGVRILAWTYSGYRNFTNSRGPVKTLDDLQGLVVRVPKNDIMIETYQSWGLNPTPMAWSETFVALQQGVVDGQDTPYAAIYSMKFGEVQKYLTELHYLFLLEPLIISEALFQKQTPEVQKALIEAGKEATAYSFDWLQEQEARIKEELVATYGMQIDQLEDEDKWAAKAMEKVWPDFYDQVGGKDKVNELLRALGREEM